MVGWIDGMMVDGRFIVGMIMGVVDSSMNQYVMQLCDGLCPACAFFMCVLM